ncbi:hypothetical protein TTHERM_00058650 (macronuclear) [Tetrahymena thermophila SB210]|uniref:Uncharacterized protein n=1 Tax=Tetrahymena thermophila (strain SB210) TaxID=312017 RepID=I7LTV3_TETTS|nr:hypothetical protein TTHERM_00058650 [Tetrahymena thermophila SB210]EAR87353.2 hypothetical protein TTHERM_00058650 [Tetrahymena thermophila SB210]|eukprot:XP_001007598.2 hypothetical protein TTHERM_00058650 [Tetrahymena thermophila SB210]
MEVYKPLDFQQVTKKNAKDQNQTSLNIKNEIKLDQQICRGQESIGKPADATKVQKSVKDTKYLTVINNANNINEKVQAKALDVKQTAQESQTNKSFEVKAIVNQQYINNFKDEQQSQNKLSSCNSKVTISSNLSFDLSLDNTQKEEQKKQGYFYQKFEDDQKQKQECQENIINDFQEQYSSSFLSECQSQSSNKQAQNNEYQFEQLSLSNKCTNSQFLIDKNDQQINNQFVKGQSFQSTLDASGQIEYHSNKKSQIKINYAKNEALLQINTNQLNNQSQQNVFQFEDIKQDQHLIKDPLIIGFEKNQLQQNDVKKQQNTSSNISQYIQKIKHRKVLCDNTKVNFLDNSCRIEHLNEVNSKNNQNLLEIEQNIKVNESKSTVNSQPNRKRVLSQQVYNNNQQKQQICNYNLQKQDQTYQQKSLTPISCSQGKQNQQHFKIEGLKQIDMIKSTGFQFIPQKNESQEKAVNLNYNFIIKQKLNSIQNTNQNKDIVRNDQKNVLEIRFGQNIDIEQSINPQKLIISQNQQAKNEKIQLFNQINEQKQVQNYFLNSQYESNQDQAKKINLLEQINNIYDTPSSVKNIMQNIKSRSNSLSHNFKSSQNQKKKQTETPKNNEHQQKTKQQGQNLKASSTKNKNNLQNNTKNDVKILNIDKQNTKIRSNTLILNNSPNSNYSNEISNISGIKTADNKKAENVNFRRRSNTNIQKNNTQTPNLDQKQSKDLNQRYTNLFNQLNLDWKIQNIKNFIEQCHPEKIMQRSSFMKQQQKKSKQVRFLEDIDLDMS